MYCQNPQYVDEWNPQTNSQPEIPRLWPLHARGRTREAGWIPRKFLGDCRKPKDFPMKQMGGPVSIVP